MATLSAALRLTPVVGAQAVRAPRRTAPARAACKQRTTCKAQSTREEVKPAMGSALVKTAMLASATALLSQHADSATAAEIVEAAAEVAEVGSPLWLVLLEYVVLAGGYLLVAPIGIYYYLTKRWFQRNKFETMLQFALVFIFFPGVFLLSPFLNFRPEKPGTQLDDPIIM